MHGHGWLISDSCPALFANPVGILRFRVPAALPSGRKPLAIILCVLPPTESGLVSRETCAVPRGHFAIPASSSCNSVVARAAADRLGSCPRPEESLRSLAAAATPVQKSAALRHVRASMARRCRIHCQKTTVMVALRE